MKKRDLATVLGLSLGLLCILFAIVNNSGRINIGGLKLFWDIPSLFITVGGSFFAILVSYPLEAVKRLPAILKNAFIDKQMPAREIILSFIELSKKARKGGLLSLENETDKIEDEFIRSGIQMVVDGIEPEIVREIMDLEIDEMENRHAFGANLLKSWAGYGAAFGMIGTLIGLVQLLANLNDPSALGQGISKAVVAAFYGAILSNFVFGPLANKLEAKSAEEVERRRMIMEGILALQSGINPRIIEDKLKTFLSPKEREILQHSESDGSVVSESE
jgi:chemotaxis protein MotA